jgi:hypothetical protein
VRADKYPVDVRHLHRVTRLVGTESGSVSLSSITSEVFRHRFNFFVWLTIYCVEHYPRCVKYLDAAIAVIVMKRIKSICELVISNALHQLIIIFKGILYPYYCSYCGNAR